MIVVKIEKWPDGDAEKAESLGVVCIANRGQVTNPPSTLPDAPKDFNADLYNYSVEVQDTKHRGGTIFRIQHFRRKGWLPLVAQALDVARQRTRRG